MRRLRTVTISALVPEGREDDFERLVVEVVNTVHAGDVEVVAFSFTAGDESDDPAAT